MIWTTENLVKGILAGNKAHLSKAITFSESTKSTHRLLANEVITGIMPYTGNSFRIGITGVPGVGKSTFIESLGNFLINEGHKVAVLAIDPSSSITHGSILGDKTRMEKLSTHPQAYIRPTAAGNTLGGLAANTQDAIYLCEAAGYDIIIIETVGVGQSETAVHDISDFFLLLMLSGAGDELQGIKRGIIEMCDGMVINKADGANEQKAMLARNQYAKALHFFPATDSGWIPKVLTASALQHKGIDKVWEMMQQFILHQKATGFFENKRLMQAQRAFDNGFQQQIFLLTQQQPELQAAITSIKSAIQSGDMRAKEGLEKILAHLRLSWE